MRKLVASLVITALVMGFIGTLTTTGQVSDPPCVVSVLNRTTFVQSDGSWLINNLPSNMGLLRARMTCTQSGATITGQSDYFEVQPGVVTQLDADIVLGVVEPVPVSLEIVAPVTTLGNSVLSVQLQVLATYPDSSVIDITLRNEGTNYNTSNPSIATVSENGLVTALSSGNVLISASNEQVFTTLSVSVALSGDTDGDGIPDDYETANGMNPNDPVDAAEDFDGDLLSNLDEFLLGTDPNNADTDGDNIIDGEEVVAGVDGFITNPLLADTDGDQINDGLEVTLGTDPTDGNDFDLQAALADIEVLPASASLVVNTVVSEATAQIVVTGQLIDGSTADLTSKTTGTTYLSSNLLVVNFGIKDGKIFAGQDGTATITVSNGGFFRIIPVTVSSFSPQALSRLDLPGFGNNVDVDGDIAYIAAGAAGLQVVSLGNRLTPTIVGPGFDPPGNANDVKILATLPSLRTAPRVCR